MSDPFTPETPAPAASPADVAELRDAEGRPFHYLIHEANADGTPKLCTGRKHRGLIRCKRGPQYKEGLVAYAAGAPYDGPVLGPAGGARVDPRRDPPPAPAPRRDPDERSADPVPDRGPADAGRVVDDPGLFIPGEQRSGPRPGPSGAERGAELGDDDGGGGWGWVPVAVTLGLVGLALFVAKPFMPTEDEAKGMGLHPVNGRTGAAVSYLSRILRNEETAEKVAAAGRFVRRLVLGAPKPREDMPQKEGGDDAAPAHA